MSNLIDHAKRELEKCGQFKEDPAFAVSVLAAVSAFAAYPGHSGGSAMAGMQMLGDLLQFKNLSPLTNDPQEWEEHAPEMWDGVNGVWQNRRRSDAFSNDAGLTYYTLEERDNPPVVKPDNWPPLHRTLITHDADGNELA